MENYSTFKVNGFSLSKALDKLNAVNKTYTRIVRLNVILVISYLHVRVLSYQRKTSI